MDTYLMSAKGQREIKNLASDPASYNNDGIVGCTATAILLTADKIYCANAGDSRCVLSTSGNARALSTDHKPSDDGELRRIKDAGGVVHFHRV